MATVKRLSNISYMPVVEHISRKFALRKETVSLKSYHGKSTLITSGYMGAGVRYAVVDGGSTPVNYFFMRKNPRLSPVGANEVDARARFTAAQKWVQEAQEDLGAITDNQIKYRDCRYYGKTIKGISAQSYKMRGFMFAVAYKILKDGGTLPADHILPAYDQIGG